MAKRIATRAKPGEKSPIALYAPYNGPAPPIPQGVLRPFLPFLPHPETAAPAQPPRPDLPPPPAGFTRTYHATPAAYPKELKQATGTSSRLPSPFRKTELGENATKEERGKRMTDETLDLIRQRTEATEWSLDEAKAAAPPGLWLAAERWRRDKPTGGVTLVCTHANGLHKEVGSYAVCSAGNVTIDEIWLLDDTNHGASLDLNAGKLGPAQSWIDDSRDVLNFVQHVLPRVTDDAEWHLRWGAATASGRPRAVIGMGHSFGGNALVQAAHARPDLFAGLFLVDPMTPNHFVDHAAAAKDPIGSYYMVPAAEAYKLLRDSPFFQPWADSIFDLYISHGIVPVDYSKPDGDVTLATPSWCEGAVFCEPEGLGLGWAKLKSLKVPAAFVMAGDATATMGPEKTREMVWRSALARNEKIVDAGHLVIQERPVDTADALWRFLSTLSAGKWGASSEEIRAEYAAAAPPRASL
ncbi:hypothetical protein VHUM_00364 [Vanrija humicola]|uniref:AB hydrolase-1 domain-containing protein n=1 Tax=Vanrija humicola TaxID=5417 RepID=A0A7D8Z1B0_VANHU|nr:hypothetical protein VHUM_00364 [Vanrija humicola]